MAEGMWPFFFSTPLQKRSDRMQLWSGGDGGAKKRQRRSERRRAEACQWVGEELQRGNGEG